MSMIFYRKCRSYNIATMLIKKNQGRYLFSRKIVFKYKNVYIRSVG